MLVESAAPLSDPAPTIGSAQFTTSGNVSGFVIFRYNPNGQEAVVPFESRNANGYLLAFDNTAGTATGIAINRVSRQRGNVPVIDSRRHRRADRHRHHSLAPNGHYAFTLVTDRYPGHGKHSRHHRVRYTAQCTDWRARRADWCACLPHSRRAYVHDATGAGEVETKMPTLGFLAPLAESEEAVIASHAAERAQAQQKQKAFPWAAHGGAHVRAVAFGTHECHVTFTLPLL